MFNRPFNTLLFELSYTAPVWVALVAGAVVLGLNRRKAPRAWRIGAAAFVGLLLAEVTAVLFGEYLSYRAITAPVTPFFTWYWWGLAFGSSLVHALAFVLLAVAILAGRDRPAADPEGGDS